MTNRESRDLCIEHAYTQGASLRECAAAEGISYERVRQILRSRGVVLRSSRARALDGAIRALGTALNVTKP